MSEKYNDFNYARRNSDYYFDDEEGSVDIREYLRIIKKRLLFILIVAVAVFSFKMMDTLSKVPIYSAYSTVLIEKSGSARNLEYQYVGWDPNFLPTQIEIIKSEDVARRVVEIAELDTKYRSYFFGKDKAKLSLIANIKRTAYSIISRIISIFSKFSEHSNKQGEQAQEKIIWSDKEIIASIVQGGLMAVPKEETKIVTISFQHKSPEIAQIIVNAAVQAYKDVTLDIKMSSSSYELEWMTAKAAEERQKLEDAETKLQKYVRENDLVTVENRLAVTPQKLNDISSQLTKAETERKELDEVYQQIVRAGNNRSKLEAIPLFATSDVLRQIREKIYKANQNIKELSKKYGPKHPVMIQANDELKILEKERLFEIERIIASTKNSYELAKTREDNFKKLFSQTKSDLQNVNEKFVQYTMMKREVDTNRVLYEALTSNIKKASVTEQAQTVNIWVVKKARKPRVPSYPNKRKEMLMGLVVGLVLGLGLSFLLEYLDNTVKSEKDLVARFNTNVLGAIENVKHADQKIESYVVREPLSPVAESYRLVRSNLLLSHAEHPPQKILVTSTSPGEGKTASTINIARVLAQEGKKVLVIDCDLRKPRMHTLFGLENRMGLSNYLTGTQEGRLLRNVPGEDLKIIVSGSIPPNPSELLNSQKMKALIEKVSEKFDFILLDSPPIERVTDGLVLSQIVDGTIIVVRARKTIYDALDSGMKKLNRLGTNVLGFVLNGVESREVGSGYYSGYNTYYAKDAS